MNESIPLKLDQGVFSKILFPLGQDEVAISNAVNNLLNEGWILSLTKTHIVMSRKWVVKTEIQCDLVAK